MKKTSHPLILMMGFVTMVCLNQSVVHAESQLMVHNNSEAKRFQEIGAITQTPGSLDPKFTSETQLSPTFIPTEKSTPWKPKSPSEYKELFDFCNRNQVDSDQWRNKLNQVTFPMKLRRNCLVESLFILPVILSYRTNPEQSFFTIPKVHWMLQLRPSRNLITVAPIILLIGMVRYIRLFRSSLLLSMSIVMGKVIFVFHHARFAQI